MMSAVAISLEDVRKPYGTAGAAVDGVTIAIREGEFFSLLGPSGCGKTTTLRMIAGFVTPDAGRVVLQGRATSRSVHRLAVRMSRSRSPTSTSFVTYGALEGNQTLPSTPSQETEVTLRHR